MRCAAQAGGTAQAGGHGATGACGLCTYAAEHMVYIYLGKYIVLLIKKNGKAGRGHIHTLRGLSVIVPRRAFRRRNIDHARTDVPALATFTVKP